ncbi:MAG: LD-carboxypeptidase [Lewinellaceae bacterium]|nr:LD-carboxypeptidase [Saprospiraceae bacterium]MCB9345028.1 LD-carboxypeptidase [Lewinellaceae bacterium]
MLRRFFLQQTGLALMASGLPFPFNSNKVLTKKKMLIPKRLKPGATIALIAPSSPPSAEKLAKALDNLQEFGFEVIEGKSLRKQNGFLAGSDQERLDDIHWAFADDAIDAVWCVRGGYGAGRLLHAIDYKLIRKHPKLFIGYSDVTALHLAFYQQCNLVTFHGPVAASDFPEDTLHHFQSVVMKGAANHLIQADPENLSGTELKPFTISHGTAQGALTGGNLTLLAALTGTKFSPEFKNRIVFIEEVGEQPYRIDRMLTQLLQGTDLSQAAGIALGVFNECEPKPGSPSFSLEDTLRNQLQNLNIPVVYGIPFGHVAHQATLPYGIQAELDADKQSLLLLESAVV